MGAVVTFSGDAGGETIGEIAYSRLRTDLLFGRLVPGERLRLDAISSRYDVSVSTMRELLNRLASEGLILAEGQRGFAVAPVSATEFREIGELRLLIESHAMARSFAAGDLEWEGNVVAAHHRLAVTEARMIGRGEGDPELWKRCDRAFHQALISACGSRALMMTHASVFDKYLRYQVLAVVFRGKVAAREHGALLDCALARDVRRAGEILRAHIEDCITFVLAADPPLLRSRPSSTSPHEPKPTAKARRDARPGPKTARS